MTDINTYFYELDAYRESGRSPEECKMLLYECYKDDFRNLVSEPAKPTLAEVFGQWAASRLKTHVEPAE